MLILLLFKMPDNMVGDLEVLYPKSF